MDDVQQTIYDRILQYSFEGGGSGSTFARRLARDNGWTPQFAGRVIEEYKRYMFLAAAAGHPVSPSDHVDQAWHLHLTYTGLIGTSSAVRH